MDISKAVKVERFMVIVDGQHRCFADVSNGIVIGVDIPKILHNPIKSKYTLDEVTDNILISVMKKGHVLHPDQDCMKRIKRKHNIFFHGKRDEHDIVPKNP